MRAFCEGSVEHFDWDVRPGRGLRRHLRGEKSTHPFGPETPNYSGNEKVHLRRGRPAPPCDHKPARPGEVGGHLMEFFLRATHEAGARVLNECRVDASSRTRSPAGSWAPWRTTTARSCTRGPAGAWILAAGGFIMNRRCSPSTPPTCSTPLGGGLPADDGLGIRVGQGAGADVANMSEGLVVNAIYPPGTHRMGVLVNAQGQRFVNGARTWRTTDACCAGPTAAAG